jgi:hypothetical protein
LRQLDRAFKQEEEDWQEPGHLSKLQATLNMFKRKERKALYSSDLNSQSDFTLSLTVEVLGHRALADTQLLGRLHVSKLKFVRSAKCKEPLYSTK